MVGWAVIAAIFLFGVWVIFLNYYYWLYLGLVRKKHHSPIALVGGLCCFLVLRYSPFVADHRWAWLPLMVDPGCIFLAGLFVYTAMASPGFSTRPAKVRQSMRAQPATGFRRNGVRLTSPGGSRVAGNHWLRARWPPAYWPHRRRFSCRRVARRSRGASPR